MIHLNLFNIVILWLCLFPMVANADNGINGVGARRSGMGGVSVALSDFWSCNSNQSGLALLEKAGIGINYSNSFGMKELSSKTIGGIWPGKFGILGFTVIQYGYPQYNEIKAGIIYARSFGPKFRLGLQLDYLQTNLGEGYGSSQHISFELGIQADLSERISLGVWTFNPLWLTLSDYNHEKRKTLIRMGLAWHISNGFDSSVEIEKDISYPGLIIRAGAEYIIRKSLFVRMGVSNYQNFLSLGFGFQYRFIRFDIAASMHHILSISPQGSLILSF